MGRSSNPSIWRRSCPRYNYCKSISTFQTSRENYHNFIYELSTVISTIKQKRKKNIIIAGDFNINLLKINEQDFCSNFFDTLNTFSLFPQIILPTRFSVRNGTLIDNFFCELNPTILQSTAGILINKLSDHQPYFIIIDITLKKTPSKMYTHQ